MDSQFLRAEELGIKLEMVNGLAVWEASPVEIELDCGCRCTV